MLRRALLCLLALVSVLGATLAMPTAQAVATPSVSSAAAPGPAFGSQFHGMWADYTDADRAVVLDRLAAHGTEWVRLDVSWATLQPEAGRFSTSGAAFVERVLDMIIARGMKPLVMLWYTPTWAAGPAGSRALPADNRSYAAVAQYAAARFAGKVKAWEVWNEPNLSHFMAGTDAAAYGRFLQTAYPAFKAGDPNALVVFGGVVYNDVDWIARAYANGAKGSFDVMATHPYQAIGDLPPEQYDGTKWTFKHAHKVRELMVAQGDGHKPMWFTEFGWSAHANAPDEPNWSRGVSEQQQADYLVRAMQIAEREMPWVTHMFWYNERDRVDDGTHNNSFGLMRRDHSPKPALPAVRNHLAARAAALAPGPQPAPSPTAPVAPTAPSSSDVAVTSCPVDVSTVRASVVLCSAVSMQR